MIILGFGHERRVGKDTAVKFAMNHMRQHHPKIPCTRFSFGDQVKKIAQQMYSWGGLQDGMYYENHPSLKEQKIAKLGNKSPRDIWEELGFAGRKINKDTWVQMSLADLDCDVAFCSDIRNKTEIDLIRLFSGSKVFKITRESAPRVEGQMDDVLRDFTDWDGIITNDQGLKEFNKKIVDLVEGIL